MNTDERRVLELRLTKEELTNYYIEHNYHATHWIILNDIICNEWDTFRLFGFTFDDGQAIQKGIALSAFILTCNQYLMES